MMTEKELRDFQLQEFYRLIQQVKRNIDAWNNAHWMCKQKGFAYLIMLNYAKELAYGKFSRGTYFGSGEKYRNLTYRKREQMSPDHDGTYLGKYREWIESPKCRDGKGLRSLSLTVGVHEYDAELTWAFDCPVKFDDYEDFRQFYDLSLCQEMGKIFNILTFGDTQ